MPLKLVKTALTPPLTAIMLALFAFNAFAVDVYVQPDGATGFTPTAPYDSWETAFATLPDAVAYANEQIDGGESSVVIHLGVGTHSFKNCVALENPITIIGSGTDNSQTICYMDNNGRSMANKQGGFMLNHVSARLENVKITGGDARTPYGRKGGGVLIQSEGGTVANCLISDNASGGSGGTGGGIQMESTNGLITHCVIKNNNGSGNGTGSGGGIYVTKGTVDNCLITGNTSVRGGGMSIVGSATVRNCTFAANKATGADGGASIFFNSTTGSSVVNNIFAQGVAGSQAGPSAPEWKVASKNAGTHFTNCVSHCAFGIPEGATTIAVAGEGSFAFTAEFADAQYHVPASSAVVGTGDPSIYADEPEATDLDGKPRLLNGKVDIGCYQNTDVSFIVTPVINPSVALAGGSITFAAETANEPAGEIDFAWTLTAPTLEEPIVFHGRSVTMNLETAGHYDVTLAATGAEPKTKEDGLHIGAWTNYLVSAKSGTPSTVPYDSWSTAATNVEELFDEVVDGATVLVGPGTHYCKVDHTIGNLKIIGVDGAGETTFVNKAGEGRRVFILNHSSALLKGVTCSGGDARGGADGGGVLISDRGGTVEDCIITKSSVNGGSCAKGGGIACISSFGVIRRTVITGNADSTTHGGSGGGGVYLSAGLVENCLIVSNKANGAAGVYMAGGRVVNCTVLGNTVPKEQKSYQDIEPQCTGGIYLSGGYVTNTIVVGNATALDYGSRPCAPEITVSSSKYLARFVNCGVLAPAAAPNESCVAAAEDEIGFVDAANGNWRLTASWESAFYKKGAYGAWMDGATDLDGRPRAHNRTRSGAKKVVDIGCYESDWLPPGMILMVK